MTNFMKIHSLGAELFHYGRTDRQDGAVDRFSQFRERAKKLITYLYC